MNRSTKRGASNNKKRDSKRHARLVKKLARVRGTVSELKRLRAKKRRSTQLEQASMERRAQRRMRAELREAIRAAGK